MLVFIFEKRNLLMNSLNQDLLSISAIIDNLTPQAAPGQSTTWLPCLGPEGSLITEYPSQRTLSGDFPRVPIITGTNVDEVSICFPY